MRDVARTRCARLDDLVLLTGEVTSNAVTHGTRGRAGGEFSISVAADDGWARVEVRDDGADDVPRLIRAGAHHAGGRGVYLVDRVSDRWGFTSDETGTLVWFEIGARA